LVDLRNGKKFGQLQLPVRNLHDLKANRFRGQTILEYSGLSAKQPRAFADLKGASLDSVVSAWMKAIVPDAHVAYGFQQVGHRQYFVFGTAKYELGIIDGDAERLIGTVKQLGVLGVHMSEHDGQPVALVTPSGRAPAFYWDIASGNRVGEPLTDFDDMTPSYKKSLVVGQVDDQLLVLVGDDEGTFKIWDARGGAPLRTIKTKIRRLTNVVVDEQGTFYFGGWRGIVAIRIASLKG
jgi:WD40 repeat protein